MDAKSRMADIYKNYKHDVRAYCRCFSEIVEKNPTTANWILLGDAYMSIQEVWFIKLETHISPKKALRFSKEHWKQTRKLASSQPK